MEHIILKWSEMEISNPNNTNKLRILVPISRVSNGYDILHPSALPLIDMVQDQLRKQDSGAGRIAELEAENRRLILENERLALVASTSVIAAATRIVEIMSGMKDIHRDLPESFWQTLEKLTIALDQNDPNAADERDI